MQLYVKVAVWHVLTTIPASFFPSWFKQTYNDLTFSQLMKASSFALLNTLSGTCGVSAGRGYWLKDTASSFTPLSLYRKVLARLCPSVHSASKKQENRHKSKGNKMSESIVSHLWQACLGLFMDCLLLDSFCLAMLLQCNLHWVDKDHWGVSVLFLWYNWLKMIM